MEVWKVKLAKKVCVHCTVLICRNYKIQNFVFFTIINFHKFSINFLQIKRSWIVSIYVDFKGCMQINAIYFLHTKGMTWNLIFEYINGVMNISKFKRFNLNYCWKICFDISILLTRTVLWMKTLTDLSEASLQSISNYYTNFLLLCLCKTLLKLESLNIGLTQL